MRCDAAGVPVACELLMLAMWWITALAIALSPLFSHAVAVAVATNCYHGLAVLPSHSPSPRYCAVVFGTPCTLRQAKAQLCPSHGWRTPTPQSVAAARRRNARRRLLDTLLEPSVALLSLPRALRWWIPTHAQRARRRSRIQIDGSIIARIGRQPNVCAWARVRAVVVAVAVCGRPYPA